MRACCWLLAALLALAGCGLAGDERAAGPAGPPEGRWRQQIHWVPMADADGTPRLLHMRLCRPPAPAPHPLAVINHGKPPSAEARRRHATLACDSEPVRWFLAHGYAVALPQRRGYGATGGAMAEAYPRCDAGRDYTRGAAETARDIVAAIDYATALAGVRRDGVVAVGQSAGGLGVIALAARNDPRIATLVSMAGGDGGHLDRVDNRVCRPEALVAAAGQFGAAARQEMLWIYAANDSYFAPDLAVAMAGAYRAAGGKLRLLQLGPFGNDGHGLFSGRGGSAVWGPRVATWLEERGAGGRRR